MPKKNDIFEYETFRINRSKCAIEALQSPRKRDR